MAIKIRPAVLADMSAVHDLVVELAVYEKAPEAVTATLLDYQNDFENDVFQCIVAENEAFEVVGMVLFYRTYSTWKGKMMYLEDFVVRESQRGQGIGELLFGSFTDAARAQGARLLKWQVLDWNTPALRFYERVGATIEKEWWNGKLFL